MSTNPTVSGNIDWCVPRMCDSGACVGVARHGEFIIGNSNNPEASVARFITQEYLAFIVGAKLVDFDHLS
jgi:hypothetical protein